ncbi:hypothetical protein SAMN03159443_05342 [Pseudomonas sp. NFACC15-1]|uniref:DUF7660 family protein n=1 Tax=unclassified Pseudomonas TaxID=196821 RepID=UPI0008828D87|nr:MULTISPECIES: hypothetical protein [unclassified Pseudomonas]SDA94857.1 hypothetical protein SAMN03159443_05342 [Pseudomonas sp. NFACC15-1]SDY71000.1 hypothetical protein SAMN03159380_04552 [Pseudomonas sp. NFACC14]
MELDKMIERMDTREEFADFICKLKEDLELNPSEWENPTLERFLDAMEAWVRAMNYYAKNSGDEKALTPSWQTFAKILFASKIYE